MNKKCPRPVKQGGESVLFRTMVIRLYASFPFAGKEAKRSVYWVSTSLHLPTVVWNFVSIRLGGHQLKLILWRLVSSVLV